MRTFTKLIVTAAVTAFIPVVGGLSVATAADEAGKPAAGGPTLKTRLADPQAVLPFINGLVAFDDAADSAKAKGTPELPERLRALEAAAPRLKSEARALAQRLSTANEVAAYNALALETARSRGLTDIAGELERAGGAHAVLLNADKHIDGEVNSRRKLAGPPTARLMLRLRDLTVLSLLGVGDAHAGTVCSLILFTFTLGYADTANYKYCMGNYSFAR